ncbi:MAG: nucleotide exchange factor GrpE [Acidobacteria bacterium]|nr:nucleotide exchange factor GrpE [Acidobacteriota bacterium]
MNEQNNREAPDIEAAEEAAAPVGELSLEEQVHKLEEELKRLTERIQQQEEEKQGLFNQLVRRQADFENYRKRAEREQQEFRQNAERELVARLLPVLDGFERALATPSSAGDDYRQGVELIYKQLRDILVHAGLEPLEAAGKTFDPLYHHAITRVETADYPDEQVLEELQRGYTFKRQLIRPALVRVAVQPRPPAEEGAAAGDDEPVN